MTMVLSTMMRLPPEAYELNTTDKSLDGWSRVVHRAAKSALAWPETSDIGRGTPSQHECQFQSGAPSSHRTAVGELCADSSISA